MPLNKPRKPYSFRTIKMNENVEAIINMYFGYNAPLSYNSPLIHRQNLVTAFLPHDHPVYFSAQPVVPWSNPEDLYRKDI